MTEDPRHSLETIARHNNGDEVTVVRYLHARYKLWILRRKLNYGVRGLSKPWPKD